MAATYSSFMTTRFYSPVFNTALFDGPLRIYFSQSYESVALKMYHLLQSQHPEIWSLLKSHTTKSKEHLFLMVYPEKKDLLAVFDKAEKTFQAQEWAEGMAVGIVHPQTDEDMEQQLEFLVKTVQSWLGTQVSLNEVQA